MNTNRCTIAVLIIVFMVVLSSQAAGAEVLTVTDDFGRNVTIHGVPERIISLSPANTEILFAIGAGDRVVGVTEYDNYPAEAEAPPKIGGFSTVSIEKVVALMPDFVLGSSQSGKKTVERLSELGIPVVVLNPKSVSAILLDIKLVGRVTGEEENASAVVSDIKWRLEAIKDQTLNVKKRPKVALVTWYDPLWVAAKGTVQNELLEIAGGENAFSDRKGWVTVSLEELIDRNPDVIIVSIGHGVAGRKPYDDIMNETRLKVVGAVKNGRVYTIDADIMSREGPRIVNATEIIHCGLSESFNATTTATPEPAGFEAVLAVLGLIAGLYLVRRKSKGQF